MRVAGVGLKKMLLDAEQKKVIIFYAVATCALVAWLCNMKAMSTWCKQPHNPPPPLTLAPLVVSLASWTQWALNYCPLVRARR